MKVYKSNEIRNISLLGNKGSGKTTLAESIIFDCGLINRRGTIDAGNTVCDYFPVEKEYGNSVFSTIFSVENKGKTVDRDYIEREYEDCTPQYIAQKILDALGE
jgi:elongation factor G